TKGSGQEGAPFAAGTQHWEIFLCADVGNVERAVLAHPANLWSIDTDLPADIKYGTKMSPRNHSVPLAEPQQHGINPTNPGGARDGGGQHRLHVGGRPADDAEHLGCRRLMLQGLAQFCVAFLQFFEEPYVLDGDDGLIGEGFQQFYLLVAKRTDLSPADYNGPDRHFLAHHRRRKDGTNAGLSCKPRRKLILRYCREITDMTGLAMR